MTRDEALNFLQAYAQKGPGPGGSTADFAFQALIILMLDQIEAAASNPRPLPDGPKVAGRIRYPH